MAKFLSDSDVRTIQGLIERERRRPERGLDSSVPEDARSPEVYIAKTPASGIPALISDIDATDTGTGTGFGSATGTGTCGNQPGSITCEIWQIVKAKSGSRCIPRLIPVSGLVRTVWNTSSNDIPGNEWIPIVRDKYGHWLANVGASSGTGSVVLIHEVTGPAETLTPCNRSTALGDACRPIIHLGIVQEWDETCNRWEDGDCVYVVDVNGRTLEVGARYGVVRSEKRIQALVLFPNPPCPNADNDASIPIFVDLYTVDIGDVTRVIHVDDIVGRLCTAYTGTGTGTSDGTFQDADNLKIYSGRSERWNPETCTWDVIERSVYVAELHGEGLVIGERYEGHYDSMLSVEDVLGGAGTGTGDETECAALYLVHCKGFTGTRTVVADITCEEPSDLPGSCSGLCIWQWIGSEWLLSFTNCSLGCQCPSAPNFEGLVQGQEEIRLCMEPGGGGTDAGGTSLLAVYVYDEIWECGELISVSDMPYFSHYAGCCACSSSGVAGGGGTGTGGPGGGTGTGSGTPGTPCSGTCTYEWVSTGFPSIPHWELITDACVGDDKCLCGVPNRVGAFVGEQLTVDCA